METVSENQGHRRGRPRKYEVDEYRDLKEYLRYAKNPVRGIMKKPGHTRRQQQNIVLAERATDFFDRYIDSGEGIVSRNGDAIEETTDRYELAFFMTEGFYPAQRVMTELGRLLDEDREEDFWRAAAWYARYNGTRAATAAMVIREFRLGLRVNLPGE